MQAGYSCFCANVPRNISQLSSRKRSISDPRVSSLPALKASRMRLTTRSASGLDTLRLTIWEWRVGAGVRAEEAPRRRLGRLKGSSSSASPSSLRWSEFKWSEENKLLIIAPIFISLISGLNSVVVGIVGHVGVIVWKMLTTINHDCSEVWHWIDEIMNSLPKN